MVTDKINRPSLLRWAIGFLPGTCFSTSNASPNDSEIVIIVIIIVGEAIYIEHGDGIIAQRHYFGSVFFVRENNHPIPAARACASMTSIRKYAKLMVCW